MNGNVIVPVRGEDNPRRPNDGQKENKKNEYGQKENEKNDFSVPLKGLEDIE